MALFYKLVFNRILGQWTISHYPKIPSSWSHLTSVCPNFEVECRAVVTSDWNQTHFSRLGLKDIGGGLWTEAAVPTHMVGDSHCHAATSAAVLSQTVLDVPTLPQQAIRPQRMEVIELEKAAKRAQGPPPTLPIGLPFISTYFNPLRSTGDSRQADRKLSDPGNWVTHSVVATLPWYTCVCFFFPGTLVLSSRLYSDCLFHFDF